MKLTSGGTLSGTLVYLCHGFSVLTDGGKYLQEALRNGFCAGDKALHGGGLEKSICGPATT